MKSLIASLLVLFAASLPVQAHGRLLQINFGRSYDQRVERARHQRVEIRRIVVDPVVRYSAPAPIVVAPQVQYVAPVRVERVEVGHDCHVGELRLRVVGY